MTRSAKVGALAASLASAALIAWGLTGSQLIQTAMNEDATYRLEFMSPNHFQQLLQRAMDDPAFVRLYRVPDGRLVGSSNVADMFGGNGRVTWLLQQTGQIAVGRDIMFWHVHPVSRTGAVLPIQHEIGPS